MDIGHYLAILWRRKWLIAVTAVATVAVVVAGTLQATPIYQASTTLRVAAAAGASASSADYMYVDRLMNTYTQIATSGPVLEELVKRLGVAKAPKIAVQAIANTELIRITVEDPNPILARDAANGLAEILVAQSKELYLGGAKSASEILSEQLAQVQSELNQAQAEYERLVATEPDDLEPINALSRSIALKQGAYATLLQQYEKQLVTEEMRANALSIVEPAATPRVPSKPRKTQNLVLGSMVGLMGGLGLALLFEHLDTSLRTVKQIEQATALSTLATLPSVGRRQKSIYLNGNSNQVEAYRRLRTNIFAATREQGLKSLLVTSAEPREGKSTLVANLAQAVAQSGDRVIAVDGDLRRPSLHRAFRLENKEGLSSVLTQACTLEQAVQYDGTARVWVLASGGMPKDPAALLGSSEMQTLVHALTRQYDLVLLDSPSLLAVSDATVLAPMVDGVVLVVSSAQTELEAVRAACRQLTDVKARLIGVVANRVRRDSKSRYYKYYRQSKGS